MMNMKTKLLGLLMLSLTILTACDKNDDNSSSTMDVRTVATSGNWRVTLVFFWKELERQVRVTGLVSKTSAEESDTYYNSRPEGSRLGAWASPQSQVIENRQWLEDNEQQYREKFKDKPVPRPEHWGGFRVKPVTIEFWQGRSSRLHDRLQFSLLTDGVWQLERLAP
jgi:pyridoxamine 5'-phosphate oxidase